MERNALHGLQLRDAKIPVTRQKSIAPERCRSSIDASIPLLDDTWHTLITQLEKVCALCRNAVGQRRANRYPRQQAQKARRSAQHGVGACPFVKLLLEPGADGRRAVGDAERLGAKDELRKSVGGTAGALAKVTKSHYPRKRRRGELTLDPTGGRSAGQRPGGTYFSLRCALRCWLDQR